MTDIDPQPGDEVLIRGRVKQAIRGVGVKVELFSKTDQYDAWVLEALIEQVIPAERTKTHAGNTVADAREAIAKAERLIAKRISKAGGYRPDFAEGLFVAKLRQMRAELVADLEAIGVPVEEAS